MKRFILFICCLLSLANFKGISQSKTSYYSDNGWGFGVSFPWLFSLPEPEEPSNGNFGVFFTGEKFLNKYIALRFSGDFERMNLTIPLRNGEEFEENLNRLSLNIEAIYKILPNENASPFLVAGVGVTAHHSNHPLKYEGKEYHAGYQTIAGLGMDFKLSEVLHLRTEALYKTYSNERSLIGRRTITSISARAGLVWYFGFMSYEESEKCENCPEPEGIREVHHYYKSEEKNPSKLTPKFLDIHFEFDRSTLTFQSHYLLEEEVKELKKNPEMEIEISGHTDAVGTSEYNRILSKNRVDAVYDFLVKNGISPSRITRNWFGEERPVKENSTKWNRNYNRRVEFKLLNDSK